MNLNKLLLNSEWISSPQEQSDFSKNSKDIDVYFKNIEDIIVEKIKVSNHIAGCVAWLTNKRILKELSKKETVCIVVQDEDFLRPDTDFDGNKQKFKETMKQLYNSIPNREIYLANLGINTMSSVDSGIRRCGYINKDKVPAFPRMHNKFIICDNKEVITGSFNYTENSTNSLENIVCIREKSIVNAYYRQFGDIVVMSVPLNWEGEWKPSESELRYGS